LILTVYPLGKRVTDFPQLILGVGFAAAIPFSSAMVGVDPFDIDGDGAFLAGSSLNELLTGFSLNELLGRDLHRGGAVLSLCVASGIWTVIFDTVYAHQDRQDDIKAGVRGLAVRLGDHTKLVCGALAVIQVALLVLVGNLIQLSWVYYVGTCTNVGIALAAMLILVDLDTPASCAWWFGQGTAIVGISMVAGFVGEYVASLQSGF
jgi:4-hydroxybenzoate polyprenyltransferase